MTEDQLFDHICPMANGPAERGQPPFLEVAVLLHPEALGERR